MIGLYIPIISAVRSQVRNIRNIENIVRNVDRSTNVTVASYKGVKILSAVIAFYITTTNPACVMFLYVLYKPMLFLVEQNLHNTVEHVMNLSRCNAIFHPIVCGFAQIAFRKEMVKQWHVIVQRCKPADVDATIHSGNTAIHTLSVVSV
jgi:hypothetical protein